MRVARSMLVGLCLLSTPAAARAANDAPPDPDADTDGRFQAAIDWIVSTVHVPIVTVVPGATPADPETRTEEDARILVRSVTASLGYRFSDHVRVGVMLPWTSSTITVGDRRSRGATSFGNTELDGFYEHSPFSHASLVYGLGLSGASAQGTSVDPSDQASSDQDATNRAVTAAGGRLVSAKYSPGHYAVILSVAFAYHRLGWMLESYLRTEDLRDMAAETLHRDTLKNELGLRFARRFLGRFEGGLRGWVDWVPVGLSKGDRQIAVAAAPEVRVRVGPVTTLLGLVVPIVGPQTNPRIVSGELALVLDL